MMEVREIRLPDGNRWATCQIARTLWQRMRGLLGRDGLPHGHALWIQRCGSVHTVGMRFAIDLVFLSRDNAVVRVIPDVRPGHPFVWGGWKAATVIESAAGGLDLASVPPGTRLSFV